LLRQRVRGPPAPPDMTRRVRRDEDERSLDPAQLFTNSSETTVYNARTIEVMR